MSASSILSFLDSVVPRPAGGPILLCIDGRAGSGKSTVATDVARDHDGTTRVVHTDDLCPGWDGLPQVPAILDALIGPLTDGRPGSYPRYDWLEGRVTGNVVVEPADLVIVEGVGAGSRVLRPYRSALVWLECPAETRKTRALTRDGDTFAPYWDAWAAAEETYLATDADRDAADLVLRT